MKETNGYARFGKYLLSHLGIVEDPDSLDWDYIVRGYDDVAKKTKPGLMYINWIVSTYYNMDPYEVRINKTNQRPYVTPKHVVMYLATTLYHYAQNDLRDFYTNKNRSSVSNAISKVEGWMQSDKHFREDVEQLTNKLLGYEQIYQKPITDTIGSLGSIQKANIPEGDSLPIGRNSVSIDGNGEIESSD